MSTILTAENIKKSFGREQVLRDISLSVEENTFTFILGPSGSGKSTLLNILSGLNRPTSGKVYCQNTEITGLKEPELADWKRAYAGHVFQNYLLLNNLTYAFWYQCWRNIVYSSCTITNLPKSAPYFWRRSALGGT